MSTQERKSLWTYEKEFLDLMPEGLPIKRNPDRLGDMKIKPFCIAKDPIKICLGMFQNGEKYWQTTYPEGLAERIGNISNKKAKNSIRTQPKNRKHMSSNDTQMPSSVKQGMLSYGSLGKYRPKLLWDNTSTVTEGTIKKIENSDKDLE